MSYELKVTCRDTWQRVLYGNVFNHIIVYGLLGKKISRPRLERFDYCGVGLFISFYQKSLAHDDALQQTEMMVDI